MTLAERVRYSLMEKVAAAPGPVGLALSGGMDSAALAAALREVDRRDVVTYTFGLRDRIATDMRDGRRVAQRCDFPSRMVWLPTDVATLVDDVRRLIVDLGLRGKSDVECVWPYLYVLDRAQSDGVASLLSGIHSDWYFGLSRKAAVQYKVTTSPQGMQAYRDDARAKPDTQVEAMRRYAGSLEVLAPYADADYAALFDGLTWQEVNLPRQKEPLRAAFDDLLGPLRLGKHTNLQLGDSGIADHFEKLLRSPLNVGGWTSVVGIYNAVAKEAA